MCFKNIYIYLRITNFYSIITGTNRYFNTGYLRKFLTITIINIYCNIPATISSNSNLRSIINYNTSHTTTFPNIIISVIHIQVQTIIYSNRIYVIIINNYTVCTIS